MGHQRKDQHLHAYGREQSNIDSSFRPIFIDLAAARKKGRSYEMKNEQYSGDQYKQHFIASSKKSRDETMINKKTKRQTLAQSPRCCGCGNWEPGCNLCLGIVSCLQCCLLFCAAFNA